MIENGLYAQGREPLGARVLVLGYAYLEESDDVRNSPSEALVQILAERRMEVVIHDPYVPGYQGQWEAAAVGCDAAVVMVKHQAYAQLDFTQLATLLRTPVLVDGRGMLSASDAENAGLYFRKIGVAGVAS